MTVDFNWYNPADPIASFVRDQIANGTAATDFGKRRGVPLQSEAERLAAKAQVGYVARHRGVGA